VSVFEKYPLPGGNITNAVAPDHITTKGAEMELLDSLRLPNLHYYGGIKMTPDLFSDLHHHFSFLVIASGAGKNNKLNIPGEDLPWVVAANKVYKWYNTAPSSQPRSCPLDLTHPQLVLIGLGNVSLDIARMLTKSIDELERVVEPSVIEKLKNNRVSRIVITGRKGPLESAFYISELQELQQVKGVTLMATFNAPSPQELSQIKFNPNLNEIWEFFLSIQKSNIHASKSRAGKVIHFLFNQSPAEFYTMDTNRYVELYHTETVFESTSLKLNLNRNRITILSVGNVIECIGRKQHFKFAPEIQFNGKNSRSSIPTVFGCGWAVSERGVIGTNKRNAFDTGELIVKSLEEVTDLRRKPSPYQWLTQRIRTPYFTNEDVFRIKEYLRNRKPPTYEAYIKLKSELATTPLLRSVHSSQREMSINSSQVVEYTASRYITVKDAQGKIYRISVQGNQKKSLLSIGLENNIPISHECDGAGTCGTCCADIEDGGFSDPPTRIEELTLDQFHRSPGSNSGASVLLCQKFQTRIKEGTILTLNNPKQ